MVQVLTVRRFGVVALSAAVSLALIGGSVSVAVADRVPRATVAPSAVKAATVATVAAPSLVQVKRLRVSQARVSWSKAHTAAKHSVSSSSLRYRILTPALIKLGSDGYYATNGHTGVARARVFAHNGVSNVVRITVKDLATSGTLPKTGLAPASVKWAWAHQRKQLGELAAYFSAHVPTNKQGQVRFWLDDHGVFQSQNAGMVTQRIKSVAKSMLTSNIYQSELAFYTPHESTVGVGAMGYYISQPVADPTDNWTDSYVISYDRFGTAGWAWGDDNRSYLTHL